MNFAHKMLGVSIVTILLALFLPIIEFEGVDALLASATFLYGIFYGFEISVVLQNFAQLKTLIATENAGLLAIFNLSKTIGGKFEESVNEKLEQYLLSAIDHPLSTYVQATNKEFFAIFEPLRTVEVKGDAQTAALNYINEGMYYIPQSRNQIAQVAPKDVDPPEWMMLIVLASILVIALFLGRDADLASQIAAAIFSITVIGSLLLLDEIDSNRIQEAHLEYEVFNRTLDAMDRPRYYPEFAIKSNTVKPPKGKVYRIGIFPEFPKLTPRGIKEVSA